MGLTTWSYSRYSTYDQCPKKAKYLYIDKFVEPSSPALENGTRVHKELEEFLIHEDFPLPDCGTKLKEALSYLKTKGPITEEMWGFNDEFVLVGPWDKSVWLRAKLDAHYVLNKTLFIIDFKTGKERPKNMEQLELYAICGFARYAEVNEVATELWYTDTGTIQEHFFSRAQLPGLILKWKARIKAYFTDESFLPKPSPLCGWCSFSKAKKGPCQY